MKAVPQIINNECGMGREEGGGRGLKGGEGRGMEVVQKGVGGGWDGVGAAGGLAHSLPPGLTWLPDQAAVGGVARVMFRAEGPSTTCSISPLLSARETKHIL